MAGGASPADRVASGMGSAGTARCPRPSGANDIDAGTTGTITTRGETLGRSTWISPTPRHTFLYVSSGDRTPLPIQPLLDQVIDYLADTRKGVMTMLIGLKAIKRVAAANGDRADAASSADGITSTRGCPNEPREVVRGDEVLPGWFKRLRSQQGLRRPGAAGKSTRGADTGAHPRRRDDHGAAAMEGTLDATTRWPRPSRRATLGTRSIVVDARMDPADLQSSRPSAAPEARLGPRPQAWLKSKGIALERLHLYWTGVPTGARRRSPSTRAARRCRARSGSRRGTR